MSTGKARNSIEWTARMREAIPRLRAEGRNVDAIAEQIGVSKRVFLNFRKRTGFKIAPLPKSNRRLVGRSVGK